MIHQQHCDSCGMDGFLTPAKHTIGAIHLCQRCTRNATTFTGYATWTPAMKAKLARILAADAPQGPESIASREEVSDIPF